MNIDEGMVTNHSEEKNMLCFSVLYASEAQVRCVMRLLLLLLLFIGKRSDVEPPLCV